MDSREAENTANIDLESRQLIKEIRDLTTPRGLRISSECVYETQESVSHKKIEIEDHYLANANFLKHQQTCVIVEELKALNT